MFVSEEEAKERLDSEKNLANKFGKGNRKNHDNAGRKEGDVNLHPIVRNVISAAAQLDTAKNVSNNFDVSAAQAHNLKHGKTTGTGEVKEEILQGAKPIVGEIRDKAIGILMKTLNLVDNDEKLRDLKATSLTNVAKDMASIIDKTTEKQEGSNKPVVVIISPERKTIKDYNVIEVQSEVVSG